MVQFRTQGVDLLAMQSSISAEVDTMATLTIRDLDDGIRAKLRVRAATKGVSMEAEVRSILAEAVRDEAVPAMKDPDAPGEWYRQLRRQLAENNGYWDDDFADFVSNLRKLPDGITYEEFVANKEELLAEIERARWE